MILGKNERNAITDSLLRIEKERRGFNFLRLECNGITGMTRCTVHVVDLHGRSFPPSLPHPHSSLTVHTLFTHRTRLLHLTRPISRDISSLSLPVLRPRSISPHFCLLLDHTRPARTAFSCDCRPRSLL